MEIVRKATEWALPGRVCPCCGTVMFAEPPPGASAGAVSYGVALNAAAVLLSCYGNVPSERAAHVMGMLLGVPVPPGWVDKAAARVATRLGTAGFDEAVAFGIIHNRLRDWHQGNHPGYAPGCWLRDYKEQVFLFTRDFNVNWTNNVSERGAKAAKRHQAVSGYWRTLDTLARWCRVRSYLDSAAAHGITALDAIRSALSGKPWLPALPAAA